MTTGPHDQVAAAGRGRLRASHAGREQVIGTLKAAFVQGRLTKDELDARVSQAFASRTYAELARLTADLPAGLAGAQPRGPARAQARPSMIKVVTWGTCAIIAAELLLILMLATVFPNTLGWAVAVFANLVGLPLAGGQMLDTWRENRSRGQLPPRRARRGQPRKGEQDGSPGDDLIRCQARGDVCAPHRPGHEGIQRTWRPRPVRRDRRWPASLQVRAGPAQPPGRCWPAKLTQRQRSMIGKIHETILAAIIGGCHVQPGQRHKFARSRRRPPEP